MFGILELVPQGICVAFLHCTTFSGSTLFGLSSLPLSAGSLLPGALTRCAVGCALGCPLFDHLLAIFPPLLVLSLTPGLTPGCAPVHSLDSRTDEARIQPETERNETTESEQAADQRRRFCAVVGQHGEAGSNHSPCTTPPM